MGLLCKRDQERHRRGRDRCAVPCACARPRALPARRTARARASRHGTACTPRLTGSCRTYSRVPTRACWCALLCHCCCARVRAEGSTLGGQPIRSARVQRGSCEGVCASRGFHGRGRGAAAGWSPATGPTRRQAEGHLLLRGRRGGRGDGCAPRYESSGCTPEDARTPLCGRSCAPHTAEQLCHAAPRCPARQAPQRCGRSHQRNCAPRQQRRGGGV